MVAMVVEVVEGVMVVVAVAGVEYPLTSPPQIHQMIIQCILEGYWSSLFVYPVRHI